MRIGAGHDVSLVFKRKRVESCVTYKYLGLVWDRRLTFGEYVKMKIAKARQRILLINRLMNVPASVAPSGLWSEGDLGLKSKVTNAANFGARWFVDWIVGLAPAYAFAGISLCILCRKPPNTWFVTWSDSLKSQLSDSCIGVWLARNKCAWVEDGTCTRCHQSRETFKHMLFECPCPALVCRERFLIRQYGDPSCWVRLSRSKFLKVSKLVHTLVNKLWCSLSICSLYLFHWVSNVLIIEWSGFSFYRYSYHQSLVSHSLFCWLDLLGLLFCCAFWDFPEGWNGNFLHFHFRLNTTSSLSSHSVTTATLKHGCRENERTGCFLWLCVSSRNKHWNKWKTKRATKKK